MIRDVYPGSRSWFFTHSGSRGQKDTGSRIRIRNTVILLTCRFMIVSEMIFCLKETKISKASVETNFADLGYRKNGPDR